MKPYRPWWNFLGWLGYQQALLDRIYSKPVFELRGPSSRGIVSYGDVLEKPPLRQHIYQYTRLWGRTPS